MSTDCPTETIELATTHAFRRGQLDMIHRAALAVIQSSRGKGCSEKQRQLLAEAAQAVLGLEVQP